LREADDDIDCERSAEHEEIEARQEPRRLRREQRAEQNEDDDQACLLS